jgi:putative transcriptional regulator
VESLQGQLLIASPALVDPNFYRTVVLVTAHGDEGAVGVVLNRPSEATIDEAVPQLGALANGDDVVYVGGPVNPSGVAVLAEFDEPEEAGVHVLDNVGFVDLEQALEGSAPALRRRRVFAGVAGWGGGQLEEELERDDWILEPARVDDVFAAEPRELWAAVLLRKGGSYALVARMPEDPSVN